MKNYSFLFVFLFLLLPVLGNAQFCTEEEKEVWTVVEDWWKNWKNKDIDAAFATVSEDYVGWNQKNPLSISKDKWKKQTEDYMPYSVERYYEIDPVKVVVKGDAAVVHYYYSFTNKWEFKEDKGTTKFSGKWTEFFVKENGKWMLFGDLTLWDQPEKND